MAIEEDSSGLNSAGMQFSIAGAVIMGIIYLLQITDNSTFPVDPSVSLGVAILAAVGAVLFYSGRTTTDRM